MSLHQRSERPLNRNAFFNGDRQLAKIRDLIPQKVQYVRVSLQFSTLGRGVGDPLEPVESRQQRVADPTLLNTLREPLLRGRERI